MIRQVEEREREIEQERERERANSQTKLKGIKESDKRFFKQVFHLARSDEK